MTCCQVNFFESEEAAEPWRSRHRGGAVLPVADAHAMGVELARQLLDAGVPEVVPCCG